MPSEEVLFTSSRLAINNSGKAYKMRLYGIDIFIHLTYVPV